MEKKTINEMLMESNDNLEALQERLNEANELFHARGYMFENELHNLLVRDTPKQVDEEVLPTGFESRSR